MKSPKRIDISLLDQSLKDLINAGAKIFPINTFEELPLTKDKEYYRVISGEHRNKVYAWDETTSNYVLIGADDREVDWNDVFNKPSQYTPVPHNHYWDEILGIPSKFEPTSHNHDERYYTESEIDTKLAAKSDSNHAHEWEEIQSKPTSFLPSAHTHTEADITNLDKYTKKETDDKLALKSDVTHTHADYSLNTHDHDGRYYQKSEVTSLLSGKSDKTHTHSELHTHANKSVLDTITQNDLDLLDSHEERIFNIENGYTEGHSHGNLQALNTITYSGVNANVDLIGIEQALNGLGTKAESNHSHSWSEVTGKPTSFTPSSHNHNDLYYTESEVDTLLGGKANASTVDAHVVDSAIHVTPVEKTAIGTISGKADKSYVDTELTKKASSSTLSGHTGNSTIHVTQGDKDNWNNKAEVSQIPTSTSKLTNDSGFVSDVSDKAGVTGVKNTGTSGGTAFVIEETDATKRPAIFLTNDTGRAGFFWYGSEYATYGGKFRIHLDSKADVLFTNVSDVLVDGKKVYHEGNFDLSSFETGTKVTVNAIEPTGTKAGEMWYKVL